VRKRRFDVSGQVLKIPPQIDERSQRQAVQDLRRQVRQRRHRGERLTH